MKELSHACTNVLHQLEEAFESVAQDDFCKPSLALGGSTIGQHLRHTLEFFLCLESGRRSGVVNYDRRSRDSGIESSRLIALNTLRSVGNSIRTNATDKAMVLEVSYQMDDDNLVRIPTTYFRELAYNIEHAVHHMAIIKIGIRDVAPYVSLPSDFGLAASTIRYTQQRSGKVESASVRS